MAARSRWAGEAAPRTGCERGTLAIPGGDEQQMLPRRKEGGSLRYTRSMLPQIVQITI